MGTFVSGPRPKGLKTFPTAADFPMPGKVGIGYVAGDTDIIYLWDAETSSYLNAGTASVPPAGTAVAGIVRYTTGPERVAAYNNGTDTPGTVLTPLQSLGLAYNYIAKRGLTLTSDGAEAGFAGSTVNGTFGLCVDAMGGAMTLGDSTPGGYAIHRSSSVEIASPSGSTFLASPDALKFGPYGNPAFYAYHGSDGGVIKVADPGTPGTSSTLTTQFLKVGSGISAYSTIYGDSWHLNVPGYPPFSVMTSPPGGDADSLGLTWGSPGSYATITNNTSGDLYVMSQYGLLALTAGSYVSIYSNQGGSINGGGASDVMRWGNDGSGGSKLSFFGASLATRPVVPTGSTTDALIAALQTLGLIANA